MYIIIGINASPKVRQEFESINCIISFLSSQRKNIPTRISQQVTAIATPVIAELNNPAIINTSKNIFPSFWVGSFSFFFFSVYLAIIWVMDIFFVCKTTPISPYLFCSDFAFPFGCPDLIQ